MALGSLDHESEAPPGKESELAYAAKVILLFAATMGSILLIAATLVTR